MRTIKRILILASEFGVLVLGLALSIALTSLVESFSMGFRDSRPLIALLSGLFLTAAAFLLVLRKHRPWKLQYDIEEWELSRAERERHPRRARHKRIARRILVWVPSLIAALVLFFLPVTSHLLHPRSQYLSHYRVPIPWTLTVLSWPVSPAGQNWVEAFVSVRRCCGITPFWEREPLSSAMSFQSSEPTGAFEAVQANGSRPKEFHLGVVVPLFCVESYGKSLLSVQCRTPPYVRRYNFTAYFWGRETDLPIFYKIIEGVTPVQ